MRRKKRRIFSFKSDEWIEKKIEEDREKLFQEIEKDIEENVGKDFRDPYYYSDSYGSIYNYSNNSCTDGWKDSRKSYLDYWWEYRKRIETIKDLFTDRIITFSYLDKRWFNDPVILATKEKAKDNEFQFSANALEIQLTSKDKKFRLFLVIPLAIFNYPQKVSHSYISFSLKDVSEKAKKLEHLSKEKAKEVSSLLQPHIAQLSPIYNARYLYVENAISMHRHPGRLGFSSGDLDKNPDNPGVIYRNKSGKRFAQVDYVMVWDPEMDVYTGESRYIMLRERMVQEKPLPCGWYIRNPSILVFRRDPLKQETKLFHKYLGGVIEKQPENYSILHDQEYANYDIENTALGKYFIQLFEKALESYKPHISVDPNHISLYYQFNPYNQSHNQSSNKSHNKHWWDLDI
ncbi:MAG: hypothetical protein QW350_04030 [Candidatus Aenigmatarchaeota archaeon]